MVNTPQHTAILIFTRTAVSEAQNKCFQSNSSFQQNVAVAKTLIDHTISIVKKTNLPYFIIDDTQQKGEQFNERLANATQSIFDKGFENTIIIGTDCPCLTEQNILEAVNQLNTNQVVIGPAKDKGVYLIGLHRSQFNIKRFLALPWLTSKLTDAFLKYAPKVAILATKGDIDNPQALKAFFKNTSFYSFLKQQIKRILRQLPSPLPFYQNIIKVFLFSFSFGLRAPPLVN